MFENITKGEWSIDDTNTGLIVSDSEVGEFIASIPNHWYNAKQNAEFISFCGTLQQKYDIGLFEEAIDLFHTLIYSETVNDFYCDKINNLLNSINQNK